MPETVEVIAKELHILVELKATEVKKLRMAFNMCEGLLIGKSDEELKAWDYFVKEFYPYIDQLHKDLSKNGIGSTAGDRT